MGTDCRFVQILTERLLDEDLMDSTRKRIVLDCRHFCDWYRGTYASDPDPDDLALNNADLNDLKGFWLRRYQANTTERKLASMRTCLRLVSIEVLTKLRFPKVPQSPKPAPSGFSRKERLSIFRAADKLSTRDRAIVYLAMWTGARSSSISEEWEHHVRHREGQGERLHRAPQRRGEGGPGRVDQGSAPGQARPPVLLGEVPVRPDHQVDAA